jgi:hypothetical protein
MTQDRRSGSVAAKRPPDRDGDAYLALAADVAERGQAAKSRLWRSLEGSLGLADAPSLPSKLSLGCIGEGRRGIQYP